MKIVAIIPARFASTRFPGKPLVNINGKPMIQHVFEKAKLSNLFAKVVVATDDERIEKTVLTFGGEVIMTDPNHQSGTDRCGEVLNKLTSKYDVAVNIQGDEPFIKTEQLAQLVELFNNPNTDIATLKKALTSVADVHNPNIVKVVSSANNKALYFSRSPIPFVRNAPQDQWLNNDKFYKHLGLYGYKTSVLKEIVKLKPSDLELSESLEQLRWLENGYNIFIAETQFESIGIDTPEDLERINK